MRLDLIPRRGNRKELIWIKANTEKKVDKVLPGNIFILINFEEKVFTQINSQQINTFRTSSRVDYCAIQINFNLDAADKGGSCYIGNDLSPSKSFIPGKFNVIPVNVNTMRIHSGVNKI